MLELVEVSAGYGSVQALRGISLTVPDGKTVAILGRNGAGKTSVLRLIAGTLHPTYGTVRFGGAVISGQRPETINRAGIAYVPEGRHILAGLTAAENLAVGAYPRRLRRQQLNAEVDRVIGFFPALQPHLGQRGGSLSGGQQQMLAIARALMSAPALLMLDEPSLGLSPIVAESVYATLTTLQEDGLTILLVEQYVEVALTYADHAYVLEKGSIALEGTAEEMQASEEVLAAYVG